MIINRDASELIEVLRGEGYGVTSVDAHGISGKVNLVFMIIKRGGLRKVVALIQEFHRKRFIRWKMSGK